MPSSRPPCIRFRLPSCAPPPLLRQPMTGKGEPYYPRPLAPSKAPTRPAPLTKRPLAAPARPDLVAVGSAANTLDQRMPRREPAGAAELCPRFREALGRGGRPSALDAEGAAITSTPGKGEPRARLPCPRRPPDGRRRKRPKGIPQRTCCAGSGWQAGKTRRQAGPLRPRFAKRPTAKAFDAGPGTG